MQTMIHVASLILNLVASNSFLTLWMLQRKHTCEPHLVSEPILGIEWYEIWRNTVWICWLVCGGCCYSQFDTRYSYPPSDGPVEYFLDWWLMWKGSAPYGRCHPRADNPGLYKKTSRGTDGKQAQSSVSLGDLFQSCLQVPVPMPLPSVPALTSLDDGGQ